MMKKALVLVLALVFVAIATSAFATIANTKHNLTTGGGFTKTTDASATLCGFCHIPHGGNTSIPNLPLWARTLGAGPYTVYGGGATLAGTDTSAGPGTFSLTCLSCHDGTIGLGTITKNGVSNSFPMTTLLTGGLAAGGKFQAANVEPGTGYSPFISTDLQNDHPIGFTFPVLGYGSPNTPGISLVPDDPGVVGISRLTGAVTGAVFPLYVYVAGTDQFECATCHDPHLESTGSIQTKFLRAPNATLCQQCHDEK